MKNMLSEALREIRGLLNQLLTNLEGEQGIEWLAEFKKFLRKEKCWADIFTLVVNYSVSIENMIIRVDCDWNACGTSKNFPKIKTGKNEVVAKLFHFDRRLSSKEIIREMGEAGFRPADIYELLAFVAKYHPKKQCEFFIVALGSTWQDSDGLQVVASIENSNSDRVLYPRHFINIWEGGWQFLAIRIN